MGAFAAQCMHNAAAAADERLEAGLNFELFTHVTRFYGKKVGRRGRNGNPLVWWSV